MKNKKLIVIASLVVALVLGMAIVPAWAYFTATSSADRGIPIHLRPTTDITEEFNLIEGIKHVTISNDETSTEDVVVRAKVFAPAELKVTVSGTGWSGPDANGWYLYDSTVAPKDKTSELLVDVTGIKGLYSGDVKPTEEDFGRNFNVIVVYESLGASEATVDESGNVTAFPEAWA